MKRWILRMWGPVETLWQDMFGPLAIGAKIRLLLLTVREYVRADGRFVRRLG